MTWKPVVIGVDASPGAAVAAQVGWQLARTAGTEWHLVHALRDQWSSLAVSRLPERAEEFRRALAANARRQVEAALRSTIPEEVLRGLVVRIGGPPEVLQDVVDELDAGLVVLGHEHPGTPNRVWTSSYAWVRSGPTSAVDLMPRPDTVWHWGHPLRTNSAARGSFPVTVHVPVAAAGAAPDAL